MEDRKIKLKGPQRIEMPDGEVVERRVRNARDTNSGLYAGIIRYRNRKWLVFKETWASEWSDEFKAMPWKASDEHNWPVDAPKRPALNDDEREWLDRAVLWLLRRDYRPTSRWDFTTTPTALAANLFNNYGRHAVERGAGEAPEPLRQWWRAWPYARKQAASATRASLNRLVRRGHVERIYAQKRGREVRAYALVEKDKE